MSSSNESVVKVKKIRKKREVNITPEMEAHLDKSGTHCLKCGTKQKILSQSYFKWHLGNSGIL